MQNCASSNKIYQRKYNQTVPGFSLDQSRAASLRAISPPVKLNYEKNLSECDVCAMIRSK
jgi:hypothetical protein